MPLKSVRRERGGRGTGSAPVRPRSGPDDRDSKGGGEVSEGRKGGGKGGRPSLARSPVLLPIVSREKTEGKGKGRGTRPALLLLHFYFGNGKGKGREKKKGGTEPSHTSLSFRASDKGEGRRKRGDLRRGGKKRGMDGLVGCSSSSWLASLEKRKEELQEGRTRSPSGSLPEGGGEAKRKEDLCWNDASNLFRDRPGIRGGGVGERRRRSSKYLYSCASQRGGGGGGPIRAWLLVHERTHGTERASTLFSRPFAVEGGGERRKV